MTNNSAYTVLDALPGFLDYMVAERMFSPATIKKYRESIGWFLRDVGNLSIATIGYQHLISLKSRMAARGVGESRIAGVVYALKSLLGYARDVLKIPVLDLTRVKAPRPPRREVLFLTAEELETFVGSIPLRKWTGQSRLSGYRLRALVETLQRLRCESRRHFRSIGTQSILNTVKPALLERGISSDSCSLPNGLTSGSLGISICVRTNVPRYSRPKAGRELNPTQSTRRSRDTLGGWGWKSR
jgi:hypothetical protein